MFSVLLVVSLSPHIMKKIAIQGFEGSYHDIAARIFFKNEETELICCETFGEVFDAMASDNEVVALVAIENTIAGSLLNNYELLRGSGTVIVGEQKLRIAHCICCLPDEDWKDLYEVHSHPVALAQCETFLQQHLELKAVQAEDTALRAKEIKEKQLRGHAAICSTHAAKLYGMRILQENIETNKHNFTRFLVLADRWRTDELCPETVRKQADKANIVFSLPHEEGSLSAILSIFTFYRINLTKIQSLPIIGREWEYMFYVDVTFNDYIRFRQSIDAVRPLTKELTILGEYRAFENNR